MVLPLKNIIYEKINNAKHTTDKDLLKILIKEKIDVSQKDINKVLLHLEIMNLISVRWDGKDKKRIEISNKEHEKSNAMW
ncbi:MAG: hypothetical protein CMO11_04410 [Thaumarchaeota archaeon]|nr:hypothetical protein [Nitrososphaerota archaeon]|tara:strand:- start:490 stop:729 length:240 start_codon:yes stop_codon:yes gene_type:complete